MPTDITTLAIEIQSRNANSYLLKFNKNLENSDSLAKEVAKSLGIAFGAASVIAYMKRATAQSIAFNRELYNIKSIAGELNLDKIRTQLVGLDSRLGYAADNAGAFYFAYSAGVRGSEKELVNFTGEVGKLSQAIVSGQIPTMDAVTSVMNAYGLKASEVTEVTDMFFQVVKQGKTTGSALANSIGAISGVSANAGVSINDLGNAIAVLTTTMPTERAITSLSSMITAFIKPTDAAKEAAQKYGIELSAAALRAKGLSGILAEMNQKVGTNTEAIAEIVPSIEGMRAAVALAGGQYKMFADNIEIFANKGGSAAQAFAAQADNLDKQITSIPVTLNKINNEVGETVKSVLTLNGVLTPAISAFNSMDTETIKLVAGITTAVGAYVLLKGGIAAVNTILAIREKLIQKNISQTQAETVENYKNAQSVLAQTQAIKSAVDAKKQYVSLGQYSDSFSGSQSFSKHTLEERQEIQNRWNQRIKARQDRNYLNIIAKDMYVGASKLQNPSSYSPSQILSASNAASPNVAVSPSQMGKSSGDLIKNLKKVNSSFVETGSILQRSPLLRMGKTFASQITSLTAWKNGLSGVTSALTGGMTGLAGFANALGGIGLAVTTAVSMFKLGGDLRQQFDVWMGWEEDADEAQRRGDEAYEKTRKILEERQKFREKQEKDKQEAEKRKSDENDALNRRILANMEFQYQKKSELEKLQMARSNLRNYQYKLSMAKNEIEREKIDQKRLKWEKEVYALEKAINQRRIAQDKEMKEREKEFAFSSLPTRDRLYDVQKRINEAEKKRKQYQDNAKYNTALTKWEVDSWNTKAYKEGTKILQLRTLERDLVKQKNALDIEYATTQYEWSSKLFKGDKERLKSAQDLYNTILEQYKTTKDESIQKKLADQLVGLGMEIDEIKKSTANYVNGIVTSVDTFQKGSLEAARAESKVYEKNPILEQSKNLEKALKDIGAKTETQLGEIANLLTNRAVVMRGK